MTSSLGRVCIIGAGPGDPGLVTARGLRLLAEADVVVYDRAAEPLVHLARPEAERLEVGAPAEGETEQDAIAILLADKAREGLVVARLKWGDAFMFGSGAREALFLHEQDIPFEVVPGVPTAVASTAYAGIPIAYPGGADAVVFLKGWEGETDTLPDTNWDALAGMEATIVCNVGGRLTAALVRELLDHGVPTDRAAALIHRGTTASQQTVTATLGELAERISASTTSDPGLLVVGDVASLRNHLRWFDKRPLFGRRIVVTRSHEQARDLCERLEALGAHAIEAPTFRLGPPDDPEAVERAAASADSYDWIVFQSANAVGRFMGTLLRGPRDVRVLGRVSLCAIGPSTADRLGSFGLKADIVLPEFGAADGIGEAIDAKRATAGQRVLLVRPDHLRDVLAADLMRRGASVTDLVAYRTIPESPDSEAAQRLYRMLLDGAIDAVTFTSATGVRRFAELFGREQAADLLHATLVVSIGPVTAAAAAEFGIGTSIMPETYTVDGLIDAVVRHFRTVT